MSKHAYDYLEGGFRIFSLFNIIDGRCECGDPECQAIGKHPRISNWTQVPQWSDEQIDAMMDFGHLAGFGVCIDAHLVVDVDPRNGGFESFDKLCTDIGVDLKAESGFVVSTGGGGWHLYFSRGASDSLQYHLDGYPGIDFKSSGFVVGAGSIHKSGCEYEVLRGDPCSLTPVPDALLAILKRKEYKRTYYNGEAIDISSSEVDEIVGFIKNNDLHYEDWIKVGMAIHNATCGDGYAIWDKWSQTSAKYDASQMGAKWHSFGKSANPVTIGTLMHMAEQAGWRRSVTFEAPAHMLDSDDDASGHPFHIDSVDLLRPPGFVGKVTEWINGQCMFPREHLAAAAAIHTVGNIAGLRYTDDISAVTGNTFVFCVAGSGTGKEAIMTAMMDLHIAAGVSAAVHGAIKSEQEIIRNLLRHQAAMYQIDELGIVLGKISNAARSGASYLEGVIGIIMSAFGKSNGYLTIGGDLKEDMRDKLRKEIAMLRESIQENIEVERCEARLPRAEFALANIDKGIVNPFMTMFGATTPVTFDRLVTYEQATNGFVGRSWIVREHETNPRRKRNFTKLPSDPYMNAMLKQLYNQGTCNPDVQPCVEHRGERIKVPTTPGAKAMLDQVSEWIEDYAEQHKGKTGLEAIVKRGYELCAKISLVLAIPSGLRTEEHVRWAYAAMRKDIDTKIMLAQANILAESERSEVLGDVLRTRIISAAGYEEGEPISVIRQRAANKKYTKQDVETMVSVMVEDGSLIELESNHPHTGRKILRYVAV